MNFKEALNKKVEEVERPPLPPLGSYIFQITNYELQEDIKGKDTSFDSVNFTCVAVEATEEVDADELEQFGPLRNIQVRMSFMFDKEDDQRFKQAEYRLARFLKEHLKVEYGADTSLSEALAAASNQRFMGVLRYRADKNDPEVQYAEIGKTAPVE